MQSAYHIDSDDEEEEALATAPANVPKSATTHIHEFERLKATTTELLDPAWKNQRNKQLLNKMLDLEEATVTAKMVDFLLQEGVCNMLMGYITQVGTKQPRPTPTDNQSDALRLAYRAVMLLTADEPTEALMAFLSKRVTQLSRGIFDIYRDDSAGSFYHGYRMLECLLRSFPGEVYDSICSDEHLGSRIRDMFRYIGYAPVGETLSMLVALTPVSRVSQLYALSSKSRWMFFERLNRLQFMQQLIEVLIHPEERCYTAGPISAEQHASCATFVLQELVEKLSVEDIGELLLQPFGYTPKLLDGLVGTALHGSEPSARRSATKLLCFLLRRVADADILYVVAPAPGAPPSQAYVPNRLYPLRERIIAHIRSRMPEFVDVLLHSAQAPHDPVSEAFLGPPDHRQPVKYSAYTVAQPFTVLRSVFLELLALMVEADGAVAELISVDLWRSLMHWTVQYAQNSIFHAIFYRLVFSVLRQDNEPAQRNLIQKAKLVSFIVDNFVPFPAAADALPGKKAPEQVQNKFVARGVLMNCANAIRLQANSQPPTAFLRQFLGSHQKWVEFLPSLNAATDVQQQYAFGVRVPEHHKGMGGERGGGGMMNGGMGMGQPPPSAGAGLPLPVSELKADEVDTDAPMSFGSRYAKSLGFFDEAAWAPADGGAGAAGAEKKGKGKKKAKKKAKKRKDGEKSGDGDGEGESEGDEEDDDDDASDSDASAASSDGGDEASGYGAGPPGAVDERAARDAAEDRARRRRRSLEASEALAEQMAAAVDGVAGLGAAGAAGAIGAGVVSPHDVQLDLGGGGSGAAAGTASNGGKGPTA